MLFWGEFQGTSQFDYELTTIYEVSVVAQVSPRKEFVLLGQIDIPGSSRVGKIRPNEATFLSSFQFQVPRRMHSSSPLGAFLE